MIHNPDDGTDWDIESWMQGLSDNPALVKLLWQILGAVIRPNVSWGKAIFLYGPSGANGKGTLCALMRNLCGEGRYVSSMIDIISGLFPGRHDCRREKFHISAEQNT